MKQLKDGRLVTDIIVRDGGLPLGTSSDLGSLADQLENIADELRGVSPAAKARRAATINVASSVPSEHLGTRSPNGSALGFGDAQSQNQNNAEAARDLYSMRRKRSAIFGNPELFGEPAWDILLDLYIAHAEGKPVSVSSACIGSAAPPTTGLRWLGVLAENELILREHDPEDQRRVLVRLTDRGIEAMDEFFASIGGVA